MMALHVINCQKEMGKKIDEEKHIKAIWMALHASYALEALRFMVSFATSLAMVENRIFMGNGNIISLILQDELLHKGWTGWIIKQVVKEDEDLLKHKKNVRKKYTICIWMSSEKKKNGQITCFKRVL